MEIGKKETTIQDLRRFGISVGGVFLLIGAISLYFGKALFWIPTGIGTLLLVFGLINPESLKSVFYWWMKFAEKISIVSTFFLLGVTFFTLMLPIGILLKVIRKDILSLKLDKTAKTYWINVDEDQREEKYTTPY